MHAYELWSFIYSINFQITQIPATNHHLKKAYRCVGQDFWKKIIFFVWDLVTTGQQIEKTWFCHWKNTSKLWRTWSLALPVLNFLSLLHFFKVGEIMFKYGSLMLPAGHIIDLYCVRLSNAVPFCENYTKFYLFWCKTLKKVLDRSGRVGGGG